MEFSIIMRGRLGRVGLGRFSRESRDATRIALFCAGSSRPRLGQCPPSHPLAIEELFPPYPPGVRKPDYRFSSANPCNPPVARGQLGCRPIHNLPPHDR